MQVWFSCPEIEAILRLGDNDVFNHPECANDVGGDDGVQARGHVQVVICLIGLVVTFIVLVAYRCISCFFASISV